MLVSTAMLAVIVLGLTAMLVQTQKAFKTGIKQTTSTDAGRAVVEMIASDIAQLSDPHFTNVPNYYTTNAPPPYPVNLFWQWVPGNDLLQSNLNGSGVLVPFRTNQLEDIFVTVQTNNTWLGIGYSISNWFTNGVGQLYPGIGSLYRYTTNTTAPFTNSSFLYTNFTASLANNFTNFHRIADGVVHLKITAYDADGNENTNELDIDQNNKGGPLQYPVVVGNPTNNTLYLTNYLPHSIDIEVGILEPEAFEHARALFTSGATAAAGQYLSTCAGQVEIFRQHIIVSAAPTLTSTTP
jgi:hypothetical protein